MGMATAVPQSTRHARPVQAPREMEEEEIDHRVKQNRGAVCAWCARVRRTMAAGAGGALASAPAWTRRMLPGFLRDGSPWPGSVE